MERSADAGELLVKVDDAFVSKQNVRDLCRLCTKSHDKFMPIFEGEGLVNDISFKLRKYLPIIEIKESDALPLQLCYQCASILLTWHQLYVGCSLADQRLRELLTLSEEDSDKITVSDDNFRNDTEYDLAEQMEYDEANPEVEKDEIANSVNERNQKEFDGRIGENETGETIVDRKKEAEKTHTMQIVFAGNDDTSSKSGFVHFNQSNGYHVLPPKSENIVCECALENGKKYSLCVDIQRCNFCSMVFTDEGKIECDLRTSYEKTHPIDRVVRKSNSGSSECMKKNVKKPSLKGDTTESSGDCPSKRFECKICSKSYLTARGLVRHSVVHKRQNVAVSCNYCVQSFPNDDTRQKHINDYHRVKSDVSSSPLEGEQQDPLTVEEFLLKVETNAEYEPAPSLANDTNLKITPNELSEPERLVCSECDESFDQKETLLCHQRTQHGQTDEFKCKQCDKSFTHSELLKRHVSSSHRKKRVHNSYTDEQFTRWFVDVDGEKHLKCDQCNYNSLWYHKSRFLEHYRIHTGEKPFACDRCQKPFRTKNLLSKHVMFVHEGIKDFACTICGRKFSEKRYVLEHTRIHTNERPYICDLCGKSFRQSASLFVHKELHKGLRKFHCHICPSKFTTRSSLNMHIKRHTGERNYMCTSCGKAFVDGKHLRDHMTVHSDERPFACDRCTGRFKLLKHLKQHARTHK